MENKKINLCTTVHFSELINLVSDYSFEAKNFIKMLNKQDSQVYEHPLFKCMGNVMFDINEDISKWLIKYNNTGILSKNLKNYILTEIENTISNHIPETQDNKKITKESGYIYVLKNKGFYKIGRSKNPKNRIRSYITENPDEIKIILCEKVCDYKKSEEELHILFKDKNHRGEWFKLNNDDIKLVKNYIKKG